jgi:hypothetical protein
MVLELEVEFVVEVDIVNEFETVVEVVVEMALAGS